MNKKLLVLILGICIIVFSFLLLNEGSKANDQPGTNLEFFVGDSVGEFQKAVELRDFQFPEDFGAHPEYLTEWWYYTGNLLTEDDRHFGYQLTFFRRAITEKPNLLRESNWSTNQIYLAHFAITDTENKSHYVTDQISRGANELAGTKTDPYFSIWLNNWEIQQINDNLFSMKAKDENFEIDFQLEDGKGVIFHGEAGLSQKGEEEGNASYYFSQTRLITNGQLRIEDQWFDVDGFSWMDHEFGTSTLGENQIGWDWFSLQLDNNTELMLFQIRNNDGSTSPFSSGSLISDTGETTVVKLDDFKINVLDTWKNEEQVSYPSRWKIMVEAYDIELEIIPVINNQEMKLFFQYWEGAVLVQGMVNGDPVSGYGYVELTGYAQSMEGVF
ncbi:MAG TPA: lipocalin-like domain-containing protein [Anaerolineaceae bacterium]|nr:lipocalin-like domain-containing protein [Anaerolineaceae bacterium]